MVAIRKMGAAEAAVKGLELGEGLGEIPAADAGATGEHDAAFSWRVGLVGLSELGDRLGKPFGVGVGRFVFGQKQREQKTHGQAHAAMVQWGRAKAKRIHEKNSPVSHAGRTVDGGTVANAHHRQHFARG